MAVSPDVACLSEMGGATGGHNLSLAAAGPGPCNQSTHRALPYSPEATAVLATATTLMMMSTIVGNILVIIAVLTSRSLQGPQNLFLVSLAAADILVATLIIPFSLANELQGYWAFRTVWCEIYLALDVLFCTSSIVHLCAISLDRYLSISRPVSYGARRTPKRIKTAIAAVWLIAAVISFPPLLSLDKSEGGVEVCELNDERWYILYSTIGSFFAPCVIMILVYVRIYQIAKQHTRCPPGEKRTPAASLDHGGKAPGQSQRNGGQGDREADQSPDGPPKTPPPVSPRSPSPAPPPEAPGDRPAEIQHASAPPPPDAADDPVLPATPPSASTSTAPLHADHPQAVSDPHEPRRRVSPQTTVASPHDNSSSSGSEVEIEISARGVRGGGGGGGGGEYKKQRRANKKVQTTKGSLQGKGFKGQIQSLTQRYKHTVATPAGTRLASDGACRPEGTPMSRRKAMMNREKRFTFVLAVVIGVFVVCWFPFFFSYSLVAVCKETCTLPKPLFKFFFWIGYCNSCLNPIIYTIFNKDFRKAFKKILCRRNSKGTYF